MQHDPMSLIEEAMGAALTQYGNTMGEDFPVVPELKLVEDDDDFWADARLKDGTVVVSVTAGLINAVEKLWVDVMKQQEENGDENRDHIPGTVDDLIHTSLVWLLLHELHHYQMGHFAITGRLSLSEAKDANSFGALNRGSRTVPPALKNVPVDDLPMVEPCLEMQADHDAIEMLLDAYSPDGWHIIRARTAAIAAMIVLIEREDAKRGHDLSSHPKAATRVFQLIGHVVQMPRIEEIMARQNPEWGINPHIASEDELTAFNRQVVRPAYFDVLEFARLAAAQSIIDDLETPERFFQDINFARIVKRKAHGPMSTVGALQWGELERVNALLV